MRCTLAATIALLVWALVPGEAAFDPARSFLTTAFHLSAVEIARLDAGQVVSGTLDTKHRREVATLGIVRIKTSPSTYVERFADIASFKRIDGVLQIGKFGDSPQLSDLASLTIDEAELKRVRECRVDDCDIRLAAHGIERLRREIDWRAPDASQRASRLLLQLLVDHVVRYRQGGTAPAMEYADRGARLNVAREFASLLEDDAVTSAYAPRLRRHLLEYPSSSPEKMTDFFYWSKELVRARPVISITHVAIAEAIDDSPVRYAIGSKQIYAMHYYDASLGLTLLVDDRAAGSPSTFVVYLNRSRIDLFDGVFGGMARRIVAGRARVLVAEQLQRLQRVLAVSQPRETARP